MKINRENFLSCLAHAALGVSTKGLIDQSDCLIFRDGDIMSYNGEVRVKVPGIPGITGAVIPQDLISLVKRIPDDEVDITQGSDGQLVIEGRNKKAAIVPEQEIKLDLAEVPDPDEWKKFPGAAVGHLRRAAETCGADEIWGAATCVHIKKGVIEASDNFRLYRWIGKNGFQDEMFLPAQSIMALSGLTPASISMKGGWCYFRDGDVIVSMRGRQIERYPNMEEICKIKGTQVELPGNLGEVAGRAAITAEGEGHAARISVDIRSGKGRIKSTSKRGWYRESFALTYGGPDLSFDVHPGIMSEIIKFSPTVTVGKDRILAQVEGAHLVIALRMPSTEE